MLSDLCPFVTALALAAFALAALRAVAAWLLWRGRRQAEWDVRERYRESDEQDTEEDGSHA